MATTTTNDLLRIVMRGPRPDEKIVRVGSEERLVLEWLDHRPCALDCDRQALREDHATRKRVIDRMLGKGLISEDKVRLWLTPRGIGALHGVEVGQ